MEEKRIVFRGSFWSEVDSILSSLHILFVTIQTVNRVKKYSHGYISTNTHTSRKLVIQQTK